MRVKILTKVKLLPDFHFYLTYNTEQYSLEAKKAISWTIRVLWPLSDRIEKRIMGFRVTYYART